MDPNLPRNDGHSRPSDSIWRVPIEGRLQSPHTTEVPDPERIGTSTRLWNRFSSPEKQSIPGTDQNQPLPQVATLSPPVGQFFINSLLQGAGFVAAIAFGIYAVKSVRVGNMANQYAGQAAQQAAIANQLALLAVCLSGDNIGSADLGSICSDIVKNAALMLPDAASSLFPDFHTASNSSRIHTTASTTHTSYEESTTTTTETPVVIVTTSTPSTIVVTPTATTRTTNPSSATAAPQPSTGRGGGLSMGAKAGIGVGIGVFTITIIILGGCCFWLKRKRKTRQGAAEVPDAEAKTNTSTPKSKVLLKGFRELFMDSRVTTQTE